MSRPCAAPPTFPYPHRTLEQVWREEALDAFHRRPRPEKHLSRDEWTRSKAG